MRPVPLSVLDSDWDLFQDERLPLALGCPACGSFDLCGGLRNASGAIDCRAFCTCTDPAGCNAVCPRKPKEFIGREKEVGGWSLDNVPRVTRVQHQALPPAVIWLSHSYRRSAPLRAPAVAVPLHALYDHLSGRPRFHSRRDLDRGFAIAPGAALVIDGIGQDFEIEPAWGTGWASGLIDNLVALRPAVVTVPNFSVFLDVTRWDNFHNMKRIALFWAELTAAGIPTALHVNGRMARDFERWSDFVRRRDEVAAISFEFATGAGRASRGGWYAEQLERIQEAAGRPLTLVCRGYRWAERLAGSFQSVTVIDTSVFMKTVFRQECDPTAPGGWRKAECSPPLDELLQMNWDRCVTAGWGHGHRLTEVA